MQKFTNYTENSIDINHVNLDSELVFLTENGKQVGSLIICYNGESANVFSLAVLEKYRGKGYGKKLMDGAIKRSKARGCKTMELNTELDNTVANKLYESMGFELKGIKDEYNNYQLPL
jgi:ribosomal protein S18 acetylase RimI-like enzyme